MTMLTLALTCALLAGGGGPDDVVVECRADAEARGADVQLRDLAIVETDDPALAERLLQVSFGPRPAFGHNRVLSRQDVMLRLAREGIASDAMRLTGALQIVVHPLVTRVQERDLLEAADPVLRAAIRLEADDDIEFEPAASPSSLLVPPGRYSMELSAKLRGGALQHGSAIVDVAILVDGETFKVTHVPYRLRRFHRVLVTSRPIARNEEIAEHNVELRRLEAPPGTNPYIAAFDQLHGKVAARDLQTGQKLTLGLLADPAVILQGDPVHLVARTGNIQVATRALALEAGAVGARIAVRNLAANKIVQATVHGRGLVVIAPLDPERRLP